MKQYCDYCAEAFPHGEDFCYCQEKGRIISEQAARKPNKCNKFRLNEISVFDPGRRYKPQKRKEDDGEQIGFKI